MSEKEITGKVICKICKKEVDRTNAFFVTAWCVWECNSCRSVLGEWVKENIQEG